MTLSQAVNVNCQYFPQCGGCDFLDLDEEKYRAVKKAAGGIIEGIQLFPLSTSERGWCGQQVPDRG